ncbi:hypothetical protein Bca4012_008909 [Brassica carinata]
METTIGAHRGAGDSSLQGSSAITELSVQDAQTSAITTNPGVARVYPASSATFMAMPSSQLAAVAPGHSASNAMFMATSSPTRSGDAFGPLIKNAMFMAAPSSQLRGDTFGPSSQQCDVYGDDLKSPAVTIIEMTTSMQPMSKATTTETTSSIQQRSKETCDDQSSSIHTYHGDDALQPTEHTIDFSNSSKKDQRAHLKNYYSSKRPRTLPVRMQQSHQQARVF